MSKRYRISEGEWEIMEVVWSSGPITSADVAAELAQTRDWAPNTVRTMLARLVKKGALKHGQAGAAFLYRPAVRREQCVQGEVDSFVQRVFGGTASSLLIHFVENRKLTSEEIEELRDILDQNDPGK